MKNGFFSKRFRGDVFLDQINFAGAIYVRYALIGFGIVIALLLRIRKNRCQQIVERRRNYRCLTSAIPLGSNSIDHTVQDSHVNGSGTGLKP